MAVLAAEMKDKLLTVPQTRAVLSTTEPFESVPFAVGSDIRFELDNDWNADPNVGSMDVIPAVVRVGSGPAAQEFRLTRSAALEATSICGIPREYAWRTPARLVQDQLNYWFGAGLQGKSFQVFTAEDRAMAVARGTIIPFSNLEILDQILASIEEHYGSGEVFVDKKFSHSLLKTHLRLVVPDHTRVIENTGTDNDTWSVGISATNSLTGVKGTQLDGYLFRWWCKNGATDTKNSSGKWSRRSGGQSEEEVYAWVRKSVDEILGGLESSLDVVQQMTEMKVPHAAQVLSDVFETYKLPTRLRQGILENMVNETDLTMYSLMQAVTSVANDLDTESPDVDRLLDLGGELIHSAQERCDNCHRVLPHSH